jgi:hypothetical protein
MVTGTKEYSQLPYLEFGTVDTQNFDILDKKRHWTWEDEQDNIYETRYLNKEKELKLNAMIKEEEERLEECLKGEI